MPPAARADQAGLVGHRAGERSAAMAEQLAVGQLARGGRAVVGQERGGIARRADVDRARDQLLAGAALAGDQHREVVALQPLDLIDDAGHHGAGAEESGQQRFERPFRGRVDHGGWTIAHAAQIEALARDRRHHANAAQERMAQRTCRGDHDKAWAVGLAADRFEDQRAGAVGAVLESPGARRCARLRRRCPRGRSGGRRRPAIPRRPPWRRPSPPRATWRQARARASPATRPHPPAAAPAHRRHRRASRRIRRCRAAARRPSRRAPVRDRAWRLAPGRPAPRIRNADPRSTWRRPWRRGERARAG